MDGKPFKKLRESLSVGFSDFSQSRLSKKFIKEIGYSINQKKISLVENGERITPDVIQAYHKLFNVPYEYLFNETPTSKKENLDIGQRIGLDDRAIETLEKIMKDGLPLRHILDTLNYLLIDEEHTRILFFMYHYLFGNYTETMDGKDYIEFLDDTKIGLNGVALEVKDLNIIFLSMITELLSRMKAHQETEGFKQYGKYIPLQKDILVDIETYEQRIKEYAQRTDLEPSEKEDMINHYKEEIKSNRSILKNLYKGR